MKISHNKKFWLNTIVLFLLITATWGLKTLYFVHELQLSPHKKYILFASGGFSLVLLSVLALKKSRLNILLTSFVYLAFTFLLYADVVYERYYDAILHIELAGQANQIGDVFDSVISLIYKTDYVYWIDVPFLLISFLWFHRRMTEERNDTITTIFFGSGIAVLLFTSFFPLKGTFSDQYMVSLSGVIPAHIFTVSHTLFVETVAVESVNEESDEVREIISEFEKNQALQKLSPYYGKFKGKNLIMVQAESLNTFPIGLKVEGEEITPNINKLIAGSQYYPNTYLQIGRGNTSDAEFVANNSLYPISPKGIYKTYPQNHFQSLATVLGKLGYQTSVAHGNNPDFWNRRAAYGQQGYSEFYHAGHPLIDDKKNIGMGISDESIFSQMVELYEKSEKPFYNFIVTLSVHRPFELPKQYQYLKLPSQFEGTPTGHYLQSVHYFDKAVGKFIDQLKREELWDETIFVMYGDHYGLLPKDEEEVKRLLDVPFGEKEQFNIPLIIHHPGQKEGEVNTKTASQMDIYPTISSLLGIEEPLLQFGKTLDIEQEGFVGFAYETTKYTFYSERYNYHASHNGSFEAGTCLDNKAGKAVDLEACRPGYDKVVKDIKTSSFILENNLIKALLE